MLTRSAQNRIYERIVRAQDGRLLRVRFEVVEVAGALRGRVLSMEPVLELSTTAVSVQVRRTSPFIALPASVEADIVEAVRASLAEHILSPFSPLEFLMSQPTRAPSFN